MDGDELRRWLQRRRLAEKRSWESNADALRDPQAAIRQGLAAIALFAELNGWPCRPSPEEEKEDAALMETWARLRRFSRANMLAYDRD